MPTNSNYDGYFNGIGKAPFFTYGMIFFSTQRVPLYCFAYEPIFGIDCIISPCVDCVRS